MRGCLQILRCPVFTNLPKTNNAYLFYPTNAQNQVIGNARWHSHPQPRIAKPLSLISFGDNPVAKTAPTFMMMDASPRSPSGK